MALRTLTLPAAVVGLCLAAHSQSSRLTIEDAWNDLLGDPARKATESLLASPEPRAPKSASQDFADHFFYNTRSEVVHQQAGFSGRPTLTGVVDREPGAVADPAAIPFPGAFQPRSGHFHSSMNWGTRGWLSPRINTNFSLRYRQDLSALDIGSPSRSVLNTFSRNRLFELTTGLVEWNGLTRQGTLSDSTLRLGRQNVYGAEMATVDGFSFSLDRPKYRVSLFGGRRFTYYSNPLQRAIGGGSLGFRLPGGGSFEYQGLFHVKGIHRLVFRQPLEPSWRVGAHYKSVGSRPVDVGAHLGYLPADGRTGARFAFAQKLSEHDFIYDYTTWVSDRDSFNRLRRLNFGVISPHRQFSVEAHRQLFEAATVGGAVWVRRLNRESDAGPFDTSFEDYRAHLELFPLRRTTLLLELHRRRTDRPSPLGAQDFDEVRNAGETRTRDISLEVSRSFGEDRLGLSLGGYHREIDLQNRFFFMDGARVVGAIGGAWLRLNQRTRLYFRYGLDEDFTLFRPSLQRFQTYRMGLDWRL